MRCASMTKWAAVLTLGLAATFNAYAQNSEITIGNDSGAIGADVDVPVTFNTNNHNIANWDLDIGYDTNELSLRGGSGNPGACDNIDFGPAVSGFQVTCSEPATGVLRVLIDPPATFPIPTLPTGELFSIRFTIEATATVGSSTPVVFDAIAASDDTGTTVNPANYTANDGSVDVLNVAPNLDLTPASLNFSAETGTTSAPQAATACNDGNADGLIFSSIAISGADAANFSQTNNCPTSAPGLAQGACCTIDTTFSPNAVASFTASLDVTTNGGSGSVSLSGTGTAGPAAALSISPASHDYGDVLTGETASQTFTVTNSGESGSNASIDTITPPAGDFSVTGGTCNAGSTTLSAGASCTIALQFAPAADGAQSGSLTVDGTDTINSNSVQTSASVQGTGVTEAQFSSNPAPGTVNLGITAIGGSLNQTVTITNSGNAPLDVTCGSLQNDTAGVFTLSPDPANFTGIGTSGGTASFDVSCTVPDQATYTADLSCTSNDPNNSSFTYQFSCSARPLVIPTMQPWGLAILTLLMLVVGGISIRFFRA